MDGELSKCIKEDVRLKEVSNDLIGDREMATSGTLR